MNYPKSVVLLSLLTLSVASHDVLASEGFYIAGSIGSASIDEDFDGLHVDDSTTAYRLIGGWQMNPYFALEVGYQNFGDFEQDFIINDVSTKARLSADGYTLGVAGRLPLFGKIDLVGRLGAFFWDGEAEITSVSVADPGDVNPYFGLGLSYNFTEVFSLYSDWTRFDLDDADSDVLALGIQFRFK